MGKNTKTAAEKAAEQAARKQAPTVETDKPTLNNNNNPATKGLTQGEKVQYVATIQAERAYIMANGENPSKEIINGMSLLAQATIFDIGVGEIASGNSAVGCIIIANPKNYETFRAIGIELGVNLPEFKALPTPTEDQLKAAGIAGLLPSETRIVTVSEKDVSKKAIEKKKKEIAAEAKAVDNPAKIENAEQLKASLTALLTKPISEGVDRPYTRLQRTINFYRGYLTIQANKAEDKKAAIDKLNATTRIQMLNEIAEIVGQCTFALQGAAFLLRKQTNETGSPISAFCLIRRNAVPEKDGSIDDQYVADTVRIMLIWSCNSQIAEYKQMIAANEKIIGGKTAGDKKVAETAINHENTCIKELQDIISMTTNPSFDVVENLIEDYKSENVESIKYKLAHRIVKNIMDTYYPGVDMKTLDEDVMLKNAQQHAGIIINMFRDSLSQSIAYKEGNLIDMVIKDAPKEDPKSEEKPAEEESKN